MKRIYLLLYGIILCIIVCLFSACHKNDSTKATKHRHQHSSVAITIDEDDVVNFNKIDTLHYYIGEVDDSSYIFIIEHTTSEGISGKYYPVGNSAYISPTPFTISYRHKKYVFETQNRSTSINFDIILDTASLSGSFYPTLAPIKKQNIFFKRYHAPAFKNYKSDRYNQEIFDFQKDADIVYGNAKGFWTSNPMDEEKYMKTILKSIGKTATEENLNLTLDLYRPLNDTVTKRPLLVLLHGGAFFVGDKGGETTAKWCEHFAKSGWVVASVNYRMGFRLSKASIQKCGYEAIQDAHAAVRYLVANAKEYGIDPDYVFMGGTSAGSITALGMTFMTNATRPPFVFSNKLDKKSGNIESSGNNYHPSFKIRAIANMWGAVYDLDELNGHHISVISFHGTADNLVPFDQGFPFSNIKGKVGEMLFDKMYGSKAIHQRLDSLHVRNEFHPIEGVGHAPYQDKKGHPNDCYYFIQDKMQHFFLAELTKTSSITYDKSNPQLYYLKQQDIAKINWKIEGGFILDTKNETVTVLWQKDAPKRKLTASGLKSNGTAFSTTTKN